MKKMRLYKTLALVLMITFLTAACGQSKEKSSPQQESASEGQQFEKAPEKLKAIEANIEKIFKALEGPYVTIEEEKKQQESKTSQSTQKQQESSKPPSQGGQSQGSQQSQGGQQKKEQSKKPSQSETESSWKEIGSIISNLHYQWNDYLPDAVKKGADYKTTGNFSNALNILTSTVNTKDSIKTMTAANNAYGYIIDLYSLYRTEMSPEIKRVRYLIRNIILDSMTGSWEQAAKDSDGIKASWPMLKNTFGKEQLKDSGKLDFSIMELEKVVNVKSPDLIDIKGRVALSNIQSIEKSYEKESR